MFNTAFRDAVASIRPVLSVAEALANAAAEGALGLPPPLPRADADLVDLAIVLSALCKAAYTSSLEDVGRVTAVALPGRTDPVGATLLHFREAHAAAAAGATGDAAAGGPQQFGIWRVRGLRPGEPSALVVAFRGTATRHDALVDAAIAPSRLGRADGGGGGGGGGDDSEADGPGPATGLAAHHGFLTGARRHARDIASHVARFNGRGADARGPVWLTGHSLGGAYAAALALELLARRDGSAARFFGGGGEAVTHRGSRLAGGVVTFGSPMVWVGPPEPAARAGPHGRRRRGGGGGGGGSGPSPLPPPSPPRPAVRAAHARLAALESAHACALREAGVARPRPLTWAGFVNGADVVPRALGSPLGGVAAVLGRTLPWLAPASAAAARYRPVGSTLLIVGSTVRATGAVPAVGGGLGTASTSDAAAAALHAGRAWTAAAAGAAAVKAESAHDLAAYTAGLRAHAEALLSQGGGGGGAGGRAARPSPGAATPPRRRRAEEGGGDDPLAAACDVASAAGRALGDASAAAAARLRDAAARTAANTWRAAAAAAVVAVTARVSAARLGAAAAAVPAGGVEEAVMEEAEAEEDAVPAPPPPQRRRRLFGRKGGVVE